MEGREFVSRITASRIVLIRKSLYSSRIFEEKWTVKRMRFFQDLRINLRRSPFPGLGPSSRGPIQLFLSREIIFIYRTLCATAHTKQAKDELFLAFAWNKLFLALVPLPSMCEYPPSRSLFWKRLLRCDKNKRESCLSKQWIAIQCTIGKHCCCLMIQCRISIFFSLFINALCLSFWSTYIECNQIYSAMKTRNVITVKRALIFQLHVEISSNNNYS